MGVVRCCKHRAKPYRRKIRIMTTPQTEYRTNSRVKDIVGQRFGMLVVLSRYGSTPKKKQATWTCICDCGVTKVMEGSPLITGYSLSCGCRSRGRRLKDIVGQRFGRLLVISRHGSTIHKQATWSCICDCGKMTVAVGSDLRGGHTSSCGCYNRDQIVRKFTKHGQAKASGLSRTYRIWAGMKTRCLNPKTKAWIRYGGRGIRVHESWLDFENFYAAMGDAPPGKTLDRIKNDKGYEPGNCRWATYREQAQNQRIRSDNKTGCKGVSVSGNAYVTHICVDGKDLYLGSFPLTPEGLLAASEAYINAAKKYFGEFFCER